MKRLLSTSILVLLLFSTAVIFGAKKEKVPNQTVVVKTTLHCHKCEVKILDQLPLDKGVVDVKVSLEDNTITVVIDPSKAKKEDVLKYIQDIGYPAEILSIKEG